MSTSSFTVEILKVDGSTRTVATDRVAIEEPLEIQLSSATATGAAAKSVSITMRTPGDDHELALGFLFTEGIINQANQVESIQHVGETGPEIEMKNIVRVQIDPSVDLNLNRLERHFYTTSSCGVCGKASLDALHVQGLTSLAGHRMSHSTKQLVKLSTRVRAQQPLFSETGGLHAAAVFDSDGEILIVREDVGRHNATDKVIGSLLREGLLPGHEFGIFVSGRASFELMQKSLVAGIPLLVAVGAPSSLAVKTADEFGMTLVGFLRDSTYNIYTGEGRVAEET